MDNTTFPRYKIVCVSGRNDGELQQSLQKHLRQGDRIISIFSVPSSFHTTELRALLELRHPSWAIDGEGWGAISEENLDVFVST